MATTATSFEADIVDVGTVAVAVAATGTTEIELVQAEETHNDEVTLPDAVRIGATSDASSLQPSVHLDDDEVIVASPPARHYGKRRACPGGYMLFSNEFKLHALQKLDEGKSAAEVAEELGCQAVGDAVAALSRTNCLHGSANAINEAKVWVAIGTDVKAVLEYMREFHTSFTAGKKEPTLRKWILRFFKRCWRAPSTSMDSQDAEKSYIFV
ncbi:hypothetical protein BBO99_00000475 [Phytophthora kernoviae]|uniref:Uncharacterized protein n=2 Tax=Phytophthora kernoviae TaxID=325452 RepID=A0A3R7K856_9STRA|nr:hypothetical protein G195_003172 [Phytophthora kernoviae 00238/432]KAG2526898.1 hypothetical protein JM18_004070 [Phytophthora kernoviae]KAG2529006.1 hypothetical protein JM16_002339 [Phytophthora kernoviae]RLN32182.1 hypothetical protein BBI17_001663 [Phytophthora kernoviae]RLN85548.1 hypothetical protein BBO99_00000475 [Phytophthora kernoviae]